MSLIKLEDILKSLSLKDLKKARKLVNNYYKEKKEEIGSKRLVDTYTNQYGVYFRLERVFCNKPNCKKCNGDKPKGHGPYWYSYKNGRREYVGKKRKEELDQIGRLPNFLEKNRDNTLPYSQ